eukprot:TRINITY_DN6294_c0_g1_i1.p1 TRINITY_DN6294_c0_g1~~TRINITY_DN6294_c0_g1_i1.p1  ORF type:complete len:284 (+),score=42.62 TRINITY_DN6294_c0_g1_i1:56-907(+)
MFRPHRNSIRKSVLGVVVLVLLYILWNLGSSYRETDFTFSEFTPNQKQKWDILAPICEHIPSTSTTPTLNKIEMQMSIEDLDRTDTKSLEKFCSPFYYSRIQTFDYARDDKANCEANEKKAVVSTQSTGHTEMIRRSLALNGWSNRVHLYRNGLADFRSKMKINFHTFNKGGATLNHLNTSVNKESDGRWAEEIEIETILLDDVLPHMQEVSDNLVFWKADIEGYESRMFRGSVKVFDYYEPNIIIFEILGKSFAFTECHLEKLLHAIMDLGYGLKNLRTKEF